MLFVGPATRVASRAVALAVPCAVLVAAARVLLATSSTHQCEPGATTLTIAAVGDSLTFDHECKPSVGGNVLHIGPYYDATCDINQTWPAIATRRLRKQPCSPALGCRHAVIRNFGRRGVVLDPGHALSCRREGMPCAEALASDADVVLLMLGTNDANVGAYGSWDTAAFRAQYVSLVEAFVAMPRSPRVVIMSPPPVLVDQRYGVDWRIANSTLPAVARAVAERTGVEFLDAFSAFAGHARSAGAAARGACTALLTPTSREPAHWPPLKDAQTACLTCDGVHTTPAGSRLFADLVVRQLATRRRARAAVTTDEDDLHGTRAPPDSVCVTSDVNS